MFPWFLCVLSTPSTPPFNKNLPVFGSESIWWNPTRFSGSRDVRGYKIYQGDILVPPSVTNDKMKNAIKSKNYLWENGTIPYKFGYNFTTLDKTLIMDAMAVLESKTCVKFVENDDQETFIRFESENNGCYAPIGRLFFNEGPLPVNLQSPECFRQIGIIEHELLHVVGLFHEQARPDRDEYVNIHWCNIEMNRESDFLKGTDEELETFGLPYDFASIMHYPKWAFSKNGRPTITAKTDPEMKLGQRESPSESDFKKVMKMYECNK